MKILIPYRVLLRAVFLLIVWSFSLPLALGQFEIRLYSGASHSSFYQSDDSQHFYLESDSRFAPNYKLTVNYFTGKGIGHGFSAELLQKRSFFSSSDGGLGCYTSYDVDYKLNYLCLSYSFELRSEFPVPVFVNISPWYGILIGSVKTGESQTSCLDTIYAPASFPLQSAANDFKNDLGITINLGTEIRVISNLFFIIETGFGIGVNNSFNSPQGPIEGIVNSANLAVRAGLAWRIEGAELFRKTE